VTAVPVETASSTPSTALAHLLVCVYLVGIERLNECSFSLRVSSDHLRGQVADVVGGLFNARVIAFLDSGIQILVRRLHLPAQGLSRRNLIREDSGGLFLLRLRESQLGSQKAHPVLNHLRWIGWLMPLRLRCAGQGKKSDE
jgi:hypothetical protein